MKYSLERIGVSLTIMAFLGLVAWPALRVILGAAGVPLAVVIAIGAGAVGFAWVPATIDGAFRRRRTRAVAWTLVAVVTIVQTARLGSYMADASQDWWHTTKHEFWSKHMCMSAYFYAADLNRQGEPNVYDAAHYPGLNPDAEDRSTVANLSPDDPYQYPPQFLLLPTLAIALSDDFFEIRPVWYALQALFFVGVAALFARWYGGRAGAIGLWLLPLLWISVPSILNFQYGQFHVTTIALAVAAFVAFEKHRDGLGGALLAIAILAKGFPGIVLIPLVLARRWRSVAWTGGWAVAFTGLAWVVLGSAPFEAFFGYHLPRLQSGTAFAFEEAWPDFRAWLLAGNVSFFSFVRKLGDLGMAGMTDGVARVVHGAFSLVVLGVAVIVSRVRTSRSRAVAWLALLNLAAMTSPAAWGDYVPLGTLWMLTLLVGEASSRIRTATVAAAAAFCALLPGVVPIGSFPSPTVAMAMSVFGTLVLVATNAWVVWREVAVPADARTSRPRLARPELEVEPAL